MTNRHSLKQLENLPGKSEILGHGRIRQNLGQGNEPQIEVCIRPDVFGGAAAPPPKVEWFGSGQLGLIVSGNQYKWGRPVDPASFARFEGTLLPINQTRVETLGEGKPDNRPMAFPSALIAGAPGWLLQHAGKGHPNNHEKAEVPNIVFLPVIELLRALFGSSSDMVKQLLDGRRDPVAAPGRFYIETRRSGRRPDGSVIILANRKLKAADARVIAMLYADETRELLKFHDSVHQLLMNSDDYRNGNGAFIRPAWPWTVPIDFEFEGRLIERIHRHADPVKKSKYSWRFIATRILSIKLPSAPTAIEIRYPEQIVHNSDHPVRQGRLIGVSSFLPRLASGVVPDSGARQSDIDVLGTSFAELDIAPIEWMPGIEYEGRNDVGMRSGPDDNDGTVSTDDAQNFGEAGIRKVNVRRISDPAVVTNFEQTQARARQRTWDALEIVCDRNEWLVTYWWETAGVVTGKTACQLRTELPCPKVATIQTSGGLKALADKGSTHGDHASLGCIYETSITDTALLAVAVFDEADLCQWKWGVKRTSYPSSQVKFRLGRHTEKCMKNQLHYSNLIEKWLA